MLKQCVVGNFHEVYICKRFITRALVRQPQTAVFQAEIEVRIYRTPALKVLTCVSCVVANTAFADCV